MRSFEYAKKPGTEENQFNDAKLPEYSTKNAAGADFFAAEDTEIPSIWSNEWPNNEPKPVLVHTGIKANMNPDEVLEIYNRSSNPIKLGLVLANSVGIIDADYYNNPKNDGEIMFAYYNFSRTSVTIHKGDKIGQGIFKKFERPEIGYINTETERTGGFGSTGR